MISVAIIDGQRESREVLKNLLENSEGFRCAGIFGDPYPALRKVRENPPDVILVDLNLPGSDGLECLRALHRDFPEIEVIVHTAFTDDDHILQAFSAGASGYLTKNSFPSELLAAIREVTKGGAPMSTPVARRVISFFNKKRNPISDLSNREKEVLDLLCEGKNYRNIARQLFVSPNTVRFHLKNIYKKLQVNSRHEAVIKATRMQVVS